MKMKQTLSAWRVTLLLGLACTVIFGGSTARAQQEGPTFNLTRNAGVPGKFDLMISDGDERVISGTFTKEQMEVLRQVLIEARKFALTEEEAGKAEPKTTRIASSSQPSLVVDVAKTNNQSQLFITFTTEVGVITVEAGFVQRPLRRENGLFYQMLSRFDSLLPPAPARPAK